MHVDRIVWRERERETERERERERERLHMKGLAAFIRLYFLLFLEANDLMSGVFSEKSIIYKIRQAFFEKNNLEYWFSYIIGLAASLT